MGAQPPGSAGGSPAMPCNGIKNITLQAKLLPLLAIIWDAPSFFFHKASVNVNYLGGITTKIILNGEMR